MSQRPISLHKAFKPGTSAATWESIRYQTSKSFKHSNGNRDVSYQQLTSTAAENGHSLKNRSSSNFKHVVKIGSNGEVFVSFGNVLEVWDWSPSAMDLGYNYKDVDVEDFQFEGLYLVASLCDLLPTDEIVDFEILSCELTTNCYQVLLVLRRDNEIVFIIEKFGQIEKSRRNNESSEKKIIILPPSIHGNEPFKVRKSDRFIGISTNEGSLTIFDQENLQPLPLNLNVEVLNDDCLFDIQGRFLVYAPDEQEQDNFNNERDIIYTEVKLPLKNRSIYKKLIRNFSDSAIDGFSKLSENIQDKKLKQNLTVYLASFLNGGSSHEGSDSKANNHKKRNKVILVDLETQKVISCFKPPNGISNLSLSPFNSHLITVNERGNEIYKWDLTKIPNVIELVDFQTRGKTSSKIHKINWYSNNVFQIITKRSGSIHCFFTNNNSKNWVLPNLQVEEIGALAKINTSSTGYNNKNLANSKDVLIVKVLNSNTLYRIDLSGNYDTKYEIPSTPIQKSLLPDYIPIGPLKRLHLKQVIGSDVGKVENKSLSQVEIETCLIGDPLINNKKFEFAIYDLDNMDIDRPVDDDRDEYQDPQKFWDLYACFGNEFKLGFNLTKVETTTGGIMNYSKNSSDENVKFQDEDAQVNGLSEAMKSELVIEPIRPEDNVDLKNKFNFYFV